MPTASATRCGILSRNDQQDAVRRASIVDASGRRARTREAAAAVGDYEKKVEPRTPDETLFGERNNNPKKKKKKRKESKTEARLGISAKPVSNFMTWPPDTLLGGPSGYRARPWSLAEKVPFAEEMPCHALNACPENLH